MANTRQAKAHTGSRIAAGIVLIAFSVFCFLCAVGAFGGVGRTVSGFLVGFFGLAVYGYTLAGVILGVALTFGIRVRMRLPPFWPWRSPVLGHIKFVFPMGLSFQ